MNILDELKNDAAGVVILSDWLGEGGVPVEPGLANSRALACISGDNRNPCPHNRAAGWWEKNLKDPIAQEIRKQLEVKARLKIETPFDDRLMMCGVCGCCNQLKVHTPIKHIAAHTSPETAATYPPFCWVKQELEAK